MSSIVLSNKTYDFSKRLVQVILPAVSSLYFGLASIWNLPAAEQVVGTLAVVATFLGVVLGVSSKGYENSEKGYDGNLVVIPNQDGSKMFSLELSNDPGVLENKNSIRFKVQPHTVPEETL